MEHAPVRLHAASAHRRVPRGAGRAARRRLHRAAPTGPDRRRHGAHRSDRCGDRVAHRDGPPCWWPSPQPSSARSSSRPYGCGASRRATSRSPLIFYGGIAGGVVLISKAPGGSAALLNSYLFGAITTTTARHLAVFAVLAAVIVVVTLGLARPLFAVADDEEFARASGLPGRAAQPRAGRAHRVDDRDVDADHRAAADQRPHGRPGRDRHPRDPVVSSDSAGGGPDRSHRGPARSGGVLLLGHAFRRHHRAPRDRPVRGALDRDCRASGRAIVVGQQAATPAG